MRWSITDSPAKPASSAARATPVSQASGSSPHGNRLTWSTTLSPCDVRRSSPAGAVLGRDRAVIGAARPRGTVCTTSQPSQLELRDQRAVPLELAGQGRRRHRPVPGGVAAPALGVRGVHHHGHGGQPDLAGPGQPAPAPVLVGAEGVDDGGQPATRCARRRRARAGRRRPRWRRGRAARCRPRRAARRRRRSRRGGSGASRPRGLPRAGRADEDDERRVGKRHTPTMAEL